MNHAVIADEDDQPTIISQVKQKSKPHDKFRAILQFDSSPLELRVEANETDVTMKELRPNPKKYSFGAIRFKDGRLEACIYPLSNLDSVLWFLRVDTLEKGRFVTNQTKLREILALIMRVRYFLGLITQRKLKYLHKKGFFSNINIIYSKLSTSERQILTDYQEVLDAH